MNRVVHFEIHVADPERAAKFYQEIFGWKIEEWKFPEPMADENRYWMVKTGPDSEPGINGGMVFRKGSAPKDGDPMTAYVCTMMVSSVDEYLEKIKKAGGRVMIEKMPIIQVGWLAYARDLDGNVFGIMEDDKEAR